MRYMNYDEFTRVLDSCIQKIRDSGKEYDEVVAIVRGGLTAAHYIAKELRLPVGVYFPGKQRLFHNTEKPKNVLFVEDLVAEGRTFRELRGCLADADFQWDFLPVLVDSEYPEDFHLQGIKTSEWIVFPYEKMDKMVAGDRGLFREKTDVYGV